MDVVGEKGEAPAASMIKAMEDCPATGTVGAMDTVEVGPVTNVSGLRGQSGQCKINITENFSVEWPNACAPETILDI
ncbi:Hypothetical predicted protein [Scomber scombrus]|uniref:Uncharacterized protein n=1 Tax=Scomber scombrus TaxID=13677 RepID=A0AAV1N5A2_SCOSC